MDMIDLRIENDDLVLNSNGEPELVTGVECIAQDLVHMLREKGYAFSLIGERNQVNINTVCLGIEIEMENDSRIYPGTANAELIGGELICTARTLDNESVKVSL